MPNSKGIIEKEEVKNDRIYKIDKPSLISFFPNRENRSKVGIIICPGGGYKHLTIDKEGYQIAKWLNLRGINAFVLKYRLPGSPDVEIPYKAPLQDLQRSIKYIRNMKHQFEIDEDKIGVLGFSAGGHLAACSGIIGHTDWSRVGDSIDNINYRPDFMVLVYARITDPSERLIGSNKNDAVEQLFDLVGQVNKSTPPVFMIYANDDKTTPPEQGLLLYNAFKNNEVPAEIHIFQRGGHGFGLGRIGEVNRIWPDLCINWLKQNGILEKDY